MSRRIISLAILAVSLSCTAALGQESSANESSDAAVKWETNCAPRGCLLQTEVLRAESGDPPDSSDFHEYIGIDVAFDRQTRKPAYFVFHVNPDADRGQGVWIGFAKTGNKGSANVDSDGTSKLDLSDCDDKSCAARVPLGLVKKSKDSRNLNLIDKFLKADQLMVLYTKGGKQYRTMVSLSSFHEEYQRVVTAEFGAASPVKK
jgi:hypothetical protein